MTMTCQPNDRTNKKRLVFLVGCANEILREKLESVEGEMTKITAKGNIATTSSLSSSLHRSRSVERLCSDDQTEEQKPIGS